MATKDDIVSLSGVSRSSVFRFFRGDNVRPDAREKILSAIQQLNYPYKPADAEGCSGTFVISVREDFNYFKGYGLSITGFMNRAGSFGCTVELKTGGTDDLKSGTGPQGVLILGKTSGEEEEEARSLKERGIPYILVNRIFNDRRTNWVSVDLEAAAEEAVGYLIDLGHREIGFWGATTAYQIDRHKKRGYENAYHSRGKALPGCLFSDRDGEFEEVLQRLIDEKNLPGAWFAATDELAMRFNRVARENGIRIPEDVSLIGMDDVEPAAFMTPPLTSVHIPYQEYGAAAFDALRYQISNPDIGCQQIVLKHRLAVRESCSNV